MVNQRKYVYETDCVSADGDDITAMQDVALPVTLATLRRRCQGILEWELDMGYAIYGHGLKLKNDWHVSYYKSLYRGRPCYYIEHSHIEHVWVLRVDI